jgi:hypothetical protein
MCNGLLNLHRKVNPSTPQDEGLGLPFNKLKAPSKAEGFRVDPERRFLPSLKRGAWRRRMGKRNKSDVTLTRNTKKR